MKYNTESGLLKLPEYGRNVQEMVDELLTIEDRQKRSNQARAVVEIMLHLFPKIRELDDYERKLWDHLHVMAGFSLDIECPYPVPSSEEISRQPSKIAYESFVGRSSFYGSIIFRLIDSVRAMPVGEARSAATLAVANQMKRMYLRWNKCSVSDEDIIADLTRYSQGALVLPASTRLTRSELLAADVRSKSQHSQSGSHRGGTRKRKGRSKKR